GRLPHRPGGSDQRLPPRQGSRLLYKALRRGRAAIGDHRRRHRAARRTPCRRGALLDARTSGRARRVVRGSAGPHRRHVRARAPAAARGEGEAV
ncbi:MAG: hypothetical protein AVDCRST_MAG80-2010, partial [uncultured Rubrobacteraceae bacterium]